VNPAIWVAIVTAAGTFAGAIVASWSTRTVRKASAKTEENAATLAKQQFAMDYYERMTKSAILEAERWEKEYLEERAGRLLSERELTAIYQDHPEMEDTYRERFRRE
jgi:biopolymer transport protein ExbB/TolQ